MSASGDATTDVRSSARNRRRRGRQLLVAGALAAGFGLVSVSAADAHAELSSVSPAAGDILAASPEQIVLTFTEPVNIFDDSIRLVDASGVDVEIGDVGQAVGASTATADVPVLPEGTYVVAWRVVSSDSHPISGAYTFSVGTASSTDPGLVDSVLAGSDSVGQRWLGVGRAASFLGVALLGGAPVVVALFAPELMRSRRMRRLLVAAAVTGVAGTAVMIAAQARLTVGGWSSWADVYDTRSGRWWFARLALLAGGGAIASNVTRLRGVARRAVISVAGSFGLVLMAVVAAGGHGASGEHSAIGMTATIAHLAAMSLWVGGLVVLLVVVPRDRLWRTAARFSTLALASVIVLAATGTVNAWRQSESWDALIDSSYGRWLVLKTAMVAFVLAMASGSRWLTRSIITEGTTKGTTKGTTAGLEAGIEDSIDGGAVDRPSVSIANSVGAAALTMESGTSDGPDPRTSADTGRVLRRTVLAEMCGLTLALVATAGLVNSPPPRTAEPTRSAVAASAVTVSAVNGNRVARITLDPAIVGGTAMAITFATIDGLPEAPREVSVSATLAVGAVGPLDIPVSLYVPGQAFTDSANLPFPGVWTIEVTARYGDFDQVVLSAEINVG